MGERYKEAKNKNKEGGAESGNQFGALEKGMCLCPNYFSTPIIQHVQTHTIIHADC